MRSKEIVFILALFILVAASGAGAAELSSLKFKDTEIDTALKAIEKKAAQEGKQINIVTTPDVYGLVTVDLENVDWKTALKVILKTNDLGFHQEGNIITVSSLSKIREDQKKEDEALFAAGGTKIEAFKLKYIDAQDAKRLVSPFLSKTGTVSVLDFLSSKGWSFSTDTTGSTQVGTSSGNYGGSSSQPATPAITTTQRMTRTKVLVVSDTPQIVRQIGKILEEVDVMPKQVFIKASLLEVNLDTIRDLGIDFGTGKAGATADTPSDLRLNANPTTSTAAGASRYTKVTPSIFSPNENTGASTSVNPYTTGMEFIFKQVKGPQFEVILHALEEDVNTNTLSTPTILTLDNQEASILVGTQYPIIETDSSSYSNNVVGGSLSEYLNIGIQLRVIPQIVGEDENKINLVVHPIVSSYNDTVKVYASGSSVLTPTAQYPIIITREAETQMMVDDGDTVVMGGLLQDQKRKELMGVPYLNRLPLIGQLFDRHTTDNTKLDLLIFLTVKIVRPVTVLPSEVNGRDAVDTKLKTT